MAKKAEETKTDSKPLSIDKITASINKKFGEGTAFKMSDDARANVRFFPTPNYDLNSALGGGIAEGRVYEVYGPESSGKTTLALFMAGVMQEYGLTAIVDVENAIDPKHMEWFGLTPENIIISQPDCAENAIDVIYELIESGVKFIILDSVAALSPKAEIEGNTGDSNMGVTARLMGQALRKIVPRCKSKGVNVLFINQIRMKIGVMYGSPETTPGGNALKFFASVRLDVRRIEQIKSGDNVVGIRSKIKVVKNKVAPPFKTCELDIIYGKGIDNDASLVNQALKFKIIKQAGPWFSYEDEKFQGKDKLSEFISENPKVKEQIEHLILEEIKNNRSNEQVEIPNDDEILEMEDTNE